VRIGPYIHICSLYLLCTSDLVSETAIWEIKILEENSDSVGSSPILHIWLLYLFSLKFKRSEKIAFHSTSRPDFLEANIDKVWLFGSWQALFCICRCFSEDYLCRSFWRDQKTLLVLHHFPMAHFFVSMFSDLKGNSKWVYQGHMSFNNL